MTPSQMGKKWIYPRSLRSRCTPNPVAPDRADRRTREFASMDSDHNDEPASLPISLYGNRFTANFNHNCEKTFTYLSSPVDIRVMHQTANGRLPQIGHGRRLKVESNWPQRQPKQTVFFL